MIRITLLLLVATATFGKEDLDYIVKEMRDLKECLTKEQLRTRNLEDSIQKLEKKMKAKDDLLEKHMNAKTDQLEKEVLFLKDQPYTFICASTYETLFFSSGIFSYSKLLYSSTNVDGADMNLSTGVFTAGWGGSYTVTYSLLAYDYANKYNTYFTAYLRKNGEKIEETRHVSRYVDSGSGHTLDQAGRTLVVHLLRGETLDLWCDHCDSGVEHITFCVTQSGSDL